MLHAYDGDATKPAACFGVVPGRLRNWSYRQLSGSHIDDVCNNGSIANLNYCVALNHKSHDHHRLNDYHYSSSDHDDSVHDNVPSPHHNHDSGRHHDHADHHHDNGRHDRDDRPAHCHGHHHRHQLRLLASFGDHQPG
jgi:hypothetical protein